MSMFDKKVEFGDSFNEKLNRETLKKLEEALRRDLSNPSIPVYCASPKLEFNVKPENKTTEPDEEWVWVTGYKGTDKDMKCKNDFQFEIGTQYDMPEEDPIITCTSGFHLCLDVKDVFTFYSIGNGNRFFEVRALVRKDDTAEYGKRRSGYLRVNKLAAKSIILTRELSIDEIFNGENYKDWTIEDKTVALAIGEKAACNIVRTRKLVSLGYSQAFACYVVANGRYDIAEAVGSQPGLSMDMKAMLIFKV